MVAPTFFSRKGGGSSVMKEYEMISLKYNGRACRLYLLFFCAPEDIILSAIRPGSTKFEGKYFFNLQADPIEMRLGSKNKTQLFSVSDQI